MKTKLFKTKPFISIIAIVVVAVVIGIAGVEITSTTWFCHRCHVMNDNYDSWFHSSHQLAVETCVGCHLPESLSSKLIYKTRFGLHDMYVNITGPPDVLEASDDTKRIVNDNCPRCHKVMVSKINLDGRRCVDCHRHVPHGENRLSVKQN
ncbi:MAG: NapC/NirT family cytochrome c [Actinomycetota bacterium]|nr:NapC/NirT family cytochrome c [Actinomycetota bacterium]